MPVDVARSALAGRADDLARAGGHEVGFLAQVDVRVQHEPDAAKAFLPREPNTWMGWHGRDVLWLGPDEWLVVGPPGSERPIADELERALAGVHHGIIDVSTARSIIELNASERLDILSNGCGLDLHPRSWSDGMCAQTLLARVPVILQERSASTRVFVRPSFANYLVDWLVNVVDVRT